MKLYVISSKYQPLVTVKLEGPFWGRKPVSKKSVSTQDLQTTFNASKVNPLIACNNKEDAINVMALLLKGHNTTSDFIEKGVNWFAVPVIYTVEVDELILTQESTLNADDIVDYADTDTIPLNYDSRDHAWLREAKKSLISEKLLNHSINIRIRKISDLQLENVTDASYLKSGGESIVDVSFMPIANRLYSFLGSFIPTTNQATPIAIPVATAIEEENSSMRNN